MKTLYTLILTIIINFLSLGLTGQAKIDISLLTEDIILFHYLDGKVNHPLIGQNISSGTISYEPLNVLQIPIASNYTLTNTSNSSTSNPTAVYRKSKPVDFVNKCESWEYLPYYDVFGCKNSNDHALENHIYLKMSSPLISGNTYTLKIENAAFSADTTITFTYNLAQNISNAIHVNNIGYNINSTSKYGYVYHWMGDQGGLSITNFGGNTFKLINTITNTEAFSGTLDFRKNSTNIETLQVNTDETPNQNFLGAEVYECDFSTFNQSGTFQLEIEGIGRSVPFDISCNALVTPFQFTMKGIFNNRSGIAIDNPYTESLRPAPHNTSLTPGFAGKLKYTSTTLCEVTEPDASLQDSALWASNILGDLTNTWGWYQDAGDWDGYVSHNKIPSMLSLTYEHFTTNFVDGQLSIPESGNNIPDILDETRWLIRFYKRLKDETESKGWTTGGVPGSRIFGDLWGGDYGPNEIVRGSWQDNDRTWVVSGEDIIMTYYYAATAANFAYLLDRDGYTDPENIDWVQESENAWLWAENLYSASFVCHEYEAKWSRLYAAAALYRATGTAVYNNAFISTWNASGVGVTDVIDGEKAYGPFIYAFTNNHPTDPTVSQQVKSVIEFTADFVLLNITNDRACRWAGNPYMPMLVGHSTTPLIFEGLIGYALLKNTNPAKAALYFNALNNTADYFLGTNPLGMTWISGLGEKNPYGLLHLDSWATGDGSAKAGIVPYGPWKKSGFGVMGIWDHHWPHQWTYPNIDSWPGHERWFEQRYSALGGEYTIHQNNINAACIYGALSGAADCAAISGYKNIDLESKDNVTIYPNPNDGQFYITGVLEDYQLQIINNLGQVILNIPNQGTQFIVNTDNLGSGLYYLKVLGNNGKIFLKHIVKQ